MIVLMLGSGPDALKARDWPRRPFDRIVCINNAVAIRPDWDDHVFPEDFPIERRQAPGPGQRQIDAGDFVPAMNAHGGMVYGGGTMAFTAGYWALHALKPRILAFLGCDMVYPSDGATHFYGAGTADPLRQDITLRSLEAKATRLMVHAARAGCACVTLGRGESRLTFPRADVDDLETVEPLAFAPTLAADIAEERAGYRSPTGRYWEEADLFDTAVIDRIDRLWLTALEQAVAAE